MMSRAQERLGRRLARALSSIEFSAHLVDGRRCVAMATSEGLGAVPRVEVRHPGVERKGHLWLVAIVALEPEPRVSYAVSIYREPIERAVCRILAAERRS